MSFFNLFPLLDVELVTYKANKKWGALARLPCHTNLYSLETRTILLYMHIQSTPLNNGHHKRRLLVRAGTATASFQ
jgi:hypothetical protein